MQLAFDHQEAEELEKDVFKADGDIDLNLEGLEGLEGIDGAEMDEKEGLAALEAMMDS